MLSRNWHLRFRTSTFSAAAVVRLLQLVPMRDDVVFYLPRVCEDCGSVYIEGVVETSIPVVVKLAQLKSVDLAALSVAARLGTIKIMDLALGIYALRVHYIAPAPGLAEMDVRSYSTALTFDVAANGE